MGREEEKKKVNFLSSTHKETCNTLHKMSGMAYSRKYSYFLTIFTILHTSLALIFIYCRYKSLLYSECITDITMNKSQIIFPHILLNISCIKKYFK